MVVVNGLMVTITVYAVDNALDNAMGNVNHLIDLERYVVLLKLGCVWVR